MLLRYIVSNFKSIGHPVEFSMFPTEAQSLLVKTTPARVLLAALFLLCLTVFVMFKSKLKTSESIA